MPDVKLLFGHTINALNKTVDDFKKASLAFRIATLLISVGYFIYAIVTETGILWANSLSLAILVAYNVFELVADKLELAKTAKKAVKHAYKWLKIVIKSFTLVVMLYGIYVAAGSVNGIRIILATLMIILWVLEILFEIIAQYVTDKATLIMTGFQKDTEFITKVGNFFKSSDNKKELIKDDDENLIILEKQLKKQAEEKKRKEDI